MSPVVVDEKKFSIRARCIVLIPCGSMSCFSWVSVLLDNRDHGIVELCADSQVLLSSSMVSIFISLFYFLTLQSASQSLSLAWVFLNSAISLQEMFRDYHGTPYSIGLPSILFLFWGRVVGFIGFPMVWGQSVFLVEWLSSRKVTRTGLRVSSLEFFVLLYRLLSFVQQRWISKGL